MTLAREHDEIRVLLSGEARDDLRGAGRHLNRHTGPGPGSSDEKLH